IYGHPLINLVIPHLMYLRAIQCLFLLRTGWSPEEILYLQHSDIEFGDTVIRVATQKKRASTFRHRELSSQTREDKGGGWSPGDLLRRAAHAMRLAQKQAVGHSDPRLGSLSREHPRQRRSIVAVSLRPLHQPPKFSSHYF